MAVSVRMDPLLEKELEQAARKRGVTKSQFIVEAVQRALGKKDPYALMQQLIAEADSGAYGPPIASQEEIPYDTVKSRKALVTKLRAKHGIRGAR